MSGSVGEGFRTVYQTTKRLNWFPGHMAKGLKQIKDNLNQVNLVVEVRDARVPFSSINAEFEKINQEM
ncbi:Mitochondrial GTPase 1 [Zancudomyces culisetae]|uniref:Mitochondrial GTPase 1 n=1 Tax=Zancudomyces culisetae TaxID=1213189 RepID=A0A1R1PGC8_ZANCU|nr:Mitochondrial GTPase 1 [Zancudomyces culisetae]|eukprot:OMH80034.1 Mitochondrial GTPase 1 [Zancudomyces culisetae]